MSSIFVRPESPPPRQPTPDFVPAPLPSPHLRARMRSAAAAASETQATHVQRPAAPNPPSPPGLSPFPTGHRLLHPARSYDHMADQPRTRPDASRKRTRSSNLSASPLGTSLSLQIPASPQSADARPHRRCISNAVPYLSPPPSPAAASPVPPVPPIPPFVLQQTTPGKPVSPPLSSAITPIRLPEINDLLPISESAHLTEKPSVRHSSVKSKSIGMTCLKFFSIKNGKAKTTRTVNV